MKKYKNFVSKLDNTTIQELNNKIDYNITNFNDRKEKINNILSNTSFYEQYFDNYYKCNITSNELLSENDNVCRSLENMANYLLNSNEEKEKRNHNKIQYKIYTNKQYFDKKINKESFISAYENNDLENNIIHFFKSKELNTKKVEKQKIYKKDLQRNDWLGEILRNYNNLLNHLTEELKNESSKYNRYYLAKAKGQVIEDMIYSKDCFLGTIDLNLKAGSESTKYNLDVFNFTNSYHLKGMKYKNKDGKSIIVKGLLYFDYSSYNINSDMYCILLDLDNVIKQVKFTDFENEVLYLMRKKFNNSEIARSLNTNHVKISRTIDGIVNKIKLIGDVYDG